MSAPERQNILLRLQDSLMAGHALSASAAALPFLVGGHAYALAFSEVQRVQLLTGMVALTKYPQVPDCIVGIAASESEMLSVIDAGRLLGHGPVQNSMKSRLVVLGNGPMKGFGLMVTRVLELVDLDDKRALEGAELITAKSLHQALRSSAAVNPESQS